jgi:acyl-CoA synthetase (AMP-forming)/AMP-acid ligase II
MNLADLFLRHSRIRPGKTAMILAHERVSFGEIERRVRALQTGLRREGFRPGDRMVVLMPVGVDLYALLLALFSLGVVPVSLDASMGPRRMLQALGLSRAKGLVSVDRLLRHRFWIPRLWGMRLYSADSSGLGLRPFSRLESAGTSDFAIEDRAATDFALITYTSGSTGRPKGADRAQGILLAQHEISRELWPEASDEVDMPCFPMVALQNLACGITTVLPDVDFRALGSIDAGRVLSQIDRHGVTRISGAPAFLRSLTRHLLERHESMEWVRGLIAGGAPVPRWLCRDVLRAFPGSESFVVYGSTEAEPMAFAPMREILDSPGAGYLVGRKIEKIELRMVEGEVQVSGPHVIRRYLDNDEANRRTKIPDEQGRIWHRTGDEGHLDSTGRLWITGRIADRVAGLPNYVIEQELEGIAGVSRAAVIADGRRVYIEGDESAREAVNAHLGTRAWAKGGQLQICDALPVDARHFWKIDRESLREL